MIGICGQGEECCSRQIRNAETVTHEITGRQTLPRNKVERLLHRTKGLTLRRGGDIHRPAHNRTNQWLHYGIGRASGPRPIPRKKRGKIPTIFNRRTEECPTALWPKLGIEPGSKRQRLLLHHRISRVKRPLRHHLFQKFDNSGGTRNHLPVPLKNRRLRLPGQLPDRSGVRAGQIIHPLDIKPFECERPPRLLIEMRVTELM